MKRASMLLVPALALGGCRLLSGQILCQDDDSCPGEQTCSAQLFTDESNNFCVDEGVGYYDSNRSLFPLDCLLDPTNADACTTIPLGPHLAPDCTALHDHLEERIIELNESDVTTVFSFGFKGEPAGVVVDDQGVSHPAAIDAPAVDVHCFDGDTASRKGWLVALRPDRDGALIVETTTAIGGAEVTIAVVTEGCASVTNEKPAYCGDFGGTFAYGTSGSSLALGVSRGEEIDLFVVVNADVEAAAVNLLAIRLE